ncbi:hypothetical protein GCM10010329_86180 [Streptomyces spiroverticillatus]|uniref:DUF4177 domain-containing protein n=2 Tax=Streptomyces finlayi TaxID=67296 RepID=A0A919CG40_9ACTN|nr:hypothetical protein GCM10010329_86180 [Streptomyces spiroverticillatus]GHD20054.1 hypothetical protein GCM10010334_84240 [Streptomyces finlayi]
MIPARSPRPSAHRHPQKGRSTATPRPHPSLRHLAGALTVLGALLAAAAPAHAHVEDPPPISGSCSSEPPAKAPEPGKPAKWEYCWEASFPGANIERLNDAGQAGWEVVAPVTPSGTKQWDFLLKRPVG